MSRKEGKDENGRVERMGWNENAGQFDGRMFDNGPINWCWVNQHIFISYLRGVANIQGGGNEIFLYHISGVQQTYGGGYFHFIFQGCSKHTRGGDQSDIRVGELDQKKGQILVNSQFPLPYPPPPVYIGLNFPRFLCIRIEPTTIFLFSLIRLERGGGVFREHF